MNKREFIMQFVLNRCMAGNISTNGEFWVGEADKAWKKIIALDNQIAPATWAQYDPMVSGQIVAESGGTLRNDV